MKVRSGLAALLLAALFFALTAHTALRVAQPDYTLHGGTPPLPGASPEAAAPAETEEGPVVAWTVRVPLNTASAEELTVLPGIGDALAAAIVRHREEYGPFRTLEDLLDVPGIGESLLDNLYTQMGNSSPHQPS